jgi:hypothetical protein
MKKQVLLILFVLLILVGITFSALAFVGVVKAQERALTLPWSVIGSGGMGGTAGSYTIHSTLGQPVAGSLDGGTYHLTSGFWTEVIESIEAFFNFLPMIIR